MRLKPNFFFWELILNSIITVFENHFKKSQLCKIGPKLSQNWSKWSKNLFRMVQKQNKNGPKWIDILARKFKWDIFQPLWPCRREKNCIRIDWKTFIPNSPLLQKNANFVFPKDYIYAAMRNSFIHSIQHFIYIDNIICVSVWLFVRNRWSSNFAFEKFEFFMTAEFSIFSWIF